MGMHLFLPCNPYHILKHPFAPLTQNYIQNGAILVSRQFILVGSTFSIDLMKWLQYGNHKSLSVAKVVIFFVSAYFEIL